MQKRERPIEDKAGPDVAEALFDWLDQATDQGENNIFLHPEKDNVQVPSEIQAHFSESDPTSSADDYAFDATREMDFRTSQPRKAGVLGIITFTKREHRDEGLIYATHVNYHVRRDGGVYDLERHVTITEHGHHKVREAREQMVHPSDSREVVRAKVAQTLATALELRSNIFQTEELEKASGIRTVGSLEAQQVLEFCHGIKPHGA